MKKAWNLTKFILALFAPLAVFVAISQISKLDLEPFSSFVGILSIFFAMEIMSMQSGRESYWSIISKSRKDKMVFATSLILMGITMSFPAYFGIKTWWMVIFFYSFGYLLGFGCIKLFGSKTMYAVISGVNKKTAADL